MVAAVFVMFAAAFPAAVANLDVSVPAPAPAPTSDGNQLSIIHVFYFSSCLNFSLHPMLLMMMNSPLLI